MEGNVQRGPICKLCDRKFIIWQLTADSLKNNRGQQITINSFKDQIHKSKEEILKMRQEHEHATKTQKEHLERLTAELEKKRELVTKLQGEQEDFETEI